MWIREAEEADLEAWAALRHALSPDYPEKALLAGARTILASDDMTCLLLFSPEGSAVGFVQAEVYSGPNDPYCHVEGWYVMPEFRGRGYGRRLIEMLEGWCVHRAICLLTSFTGPEYALSASAHLHAGFRKMCDFTIFMKEVQQPPEPDK